MLLARTSLDGFVVVFFANKMFHVFIDTVQHYRYSLIPNSTFDFFNSPITFGFTRYEFSTKFKKLYN